MDAETYERVVAVIIEEFFKTKAGRIYSPRLTAEWEDAQSKHKRRVSAGSKGGKAKSLKANEINSGNAKAMPKQPEPEPEPEKRDTKVSPKKKRATRLPEDWVLPREWGQWALKEGWPEPIIRLEADKFRDFWISKSGGGAAKLDWKAVWRNWMRNSKTHPGAWMNNEGGGSNAQSNRTTRGHSGHSSLMAGFAASAADHARAMPSGHGDMPGTGDTSPAAMDWGQGGDDAGPFLRVIND